MFERSVTGLGHELSDLVPDLCLELTQSEGTESEPNFAWVGVVPVDLSKYVEMVSRTIIGLSTLASSCWTDLTASHGLQEVAKLDDLLNRSESAFEEYLISIGASRGLVHRLSKNLMPYKGGSEVLAKLTSAAGNAFNREIAVSPNPVFLGAVEFECGKKLAAIAVTEGKLQLTKSQTGSIRALGDDVLYQFRLYGNSLLISDDVIGFLTDALHYVSEMIEFSVENLGFSENHIASARGSLQVH